METNKRLMEASWWEKTEPDENRMVYITEEKKRKEKAYFCVYSMHARGLAMSNLLNSQGIISIYAKFNKIEGDA